jgi:hypothetical protein
VLGGATAFAVLLVLLAAITGGGDDDSPAETATDEGSEPTELIFGPVAQFSPLAEGAGTSATILAADAAGTTVVYTDSPGGTLGFLDLTQPDNPVSAGTVSFDGEPRAVDIHDGLALVVVATSTDDQHAGRLAVVDMAEMTEVASIDLPGEPDAIDISPDGSFAAIVIENPPLTDDGRPDAPPGILAVVDLGPTPNDWSVRTVELTGLADALTDDPEPEAVAINDANQAVVSLQENNHLVLVDLARGSVVDHFPAGDAALTDVDLTGELLGPAQTGEILFTEAGERRREPDGLAWIDDTRFVTADEGSPTEGFLGGGRGITVFDIDGTVVAEARYDHDIARVGRYPEHRSSGSGPEPEEVEVARFGDRTVVITSVEGSDVVMIHEFIDDRLELLQVIPSGFGPEGVLALPDRGLLLVAAERIARGASLISVLELGREPTPSLASASVDGFPIPWAALSGLTADPADDQRLHAVSDATFAAGFIYTIDRSGGGEIIARQRVSPADGRDLFLDLEGIAAAPEGGFWLATEGSDDAPSALLLVDADAVVQRTVPLPAAISDRTGSAVSGLAVVEGDDGRAQFVYVAFRDAPRVARYEPAADDWTTASLTVEADTLQIGGLTGLADGRLVMVATDGLPIHQGQLRQLLVVDPTAVAWSGDAASEERLPLAADLVDISPTLAAATLYSSEWLDGITSTAEGSVVIVSDNAGVRRRPGETVFLDLGPAGDLF